VGRFGDRPPHKRRLPPSSRLLTPRPSNTPTCVRFTHTSSRRNATARAFGGLEVAGEGTRKPAAGVALPREASFGRFGDRPPHKRRCFPCSRTRATTKLPMAQTCARPSSHQHPHLCSPRPGATGQAPLTLPPAATPRPGRLAGLRLQGRQPESRRRRSAALPAKASLGRFGDRPPHKRRRPARSGSAGTTLLRLPPRSQ
jgi:hypothetical protein